jgi:hypothetical protein
MPESERKLFAVGAIGNITPVLLKWWSQARAEERVTLPGDTWATFFGWFVTTLVFALFAGWFVTYVWNERTARRAFFVGLALPYMLWGVVSDVSSGVKVPRARAQAQSQEQGTGPLAAFDAFPLKLDVRAADTNQPIEATVNAHVLQGGGTGIFTFTSTQNFYLLPKGRYVVVASAPGYTPSSTEIDLTEPKTVTITLSKLSAWAQFFNGVKYTLWPPATQTTTNVWTKPMKPETNPYWKQK